MNLEMVSQIATIVSAVVSSFAVVIAYCIFRRQRTISLFNRRMEVLKKFDLFIYNELGDINWDGNIENLDSISNNELVSLFDHHILSIKANLLQAANELFSIHNTIKKETDKEEPDYQLIDQLDKDYIDTLLTAIRAYNASISKHYSGYFRI